MPENCFRSLVCFVLIFGALSAAGCGKNDPNQLENRVERTVTEFLDAWSRGEPADKFATPGGPIQGTDPDWKSGYKLLSFLSDEIKQSPEMPDHFRCRVALFLQDRNGNKADKKVVYDVQVGEKSVITRVSP